MSFCAIKQLHRVLQHCWSSRAPGQRVHCCKALLLVWACWIHRAPHHHALCLEISCAKTICWEQVTEAAMGMAATWRVLQP